jgi:hypothetical protein
MTASLADLLTAQKNGVVAINNVAQTNQKSLGTQTSITVTSSTSVIVGSGYLVNFSVVVAGSSAGTIYNASATSATAASNALCAIPDVVGIYKAGQAYSAGLVVVPGTGQSVNITYSPG